MSEGPPWSPCVSVATGGRAVPSGAGLEREGSPQVTTTPSRALHRVLSFCSPCPSQSKGDGSHCPGATDVEAGTAGVRKCAQSKQLTGHPGPCPDARCRVRGAPPPGATGAVSSSSEKCLCVLLALQSPPRALQGPGPAVSLRL